MLFWLVFVTFGLLLVPLSRPARLVLPVISYLQELNPWLLSIPCVMTQQVGEVEGLISRWRGLE